MPVPTINDVMEAYATDAETDARKRGITLDYSEPSLAQVDRILETLTPSGVLSPKSPAEEDALWMLSKIYGGYVGQVVIKQMGDSGSYRICLTVAHEFCSAVPASKRFL